MLTPGEKQRAFDIFNEALYYAYNEVAEGLSKGDPKNINIYTEYGEVLKRLPDQDLLKAYAAEVLSDHPWTIIVTATKPMPNKEMQSVYVLEWLPTAEDPLFRLLTEEEVQASMHTGDDGLQHFIPDDTGRAYDIADNYTYFEEMILLGMQFVCDLQKEPEYFYTNNDVMARFSEYLDDDKIEGAQTIEEPRISHNNETGLDEIVMYKRLSIKMRAEGMYYFLDADSLNQIDAKMAVRPSFATVCDMIEEEVQSSTQQSYTVHILLPNFMQEIGTENYNHARRLLRENIILYRYSSLKKVSDDESEQEKGFASGYSIPPNNPKNRQESMDFSITLTPDWYAALKHKQYRLKRPRSLHKIPDSYSVCARMVRDLTAVQRFDANHHKKEKGILATTLLDRYFRKKADNNRHGEKRLRIDPFFTQLNMAIERDVFRDIIFRKGRSRKSFEEARETYTSYESLAGVYVEAINAPEHGDYIEVQKKRTAAIEKQKKKQHPRQKKPEKSTADGANSTTDGANE